MTSQAEGYEESHSQTPLDNSQGSEDGLGSEENSFSSGPRNSVETLSSTPDEPLDLESFEHSFNIILLGDSGVGKTELVNSLSNPNNHKKYKTKFFATIGINMETHYMELDDKKIKFQIWDPSGSDRFRSMITKYFQNAHGVMLIYDLNYYKSFQSIKDWTTQIHNHPQLNYNQVAKILIGNKADIDKRAVSWEEGSNFAQEHKMRFLETSTITGENVDSCFRILCQDMIQLNPTASRTKD